MIKLYDFKNTCHVIKLPVCNCTNLNISKQNLKIKKVYK